MLQVYILLIYSEYVFFDMPHMYSWEAMCRNKIIIVIIIIVVMNVSRM